MNTSNKTNLPEPPAAQGHRVSGHADRRWWLRLVIQPLMFLVGGLLIIISLAVAQRSGWISAAGHSHGHAAATGLGTRYICPMMCTPPQEEPGRCPVCAMELVPASDSPGGDSRSVYIDPASRRVANIQTIAVEAVPLTRTIRAVGELQYDEGGLRTISAYVEGRLDRLYADFTGVAVKQGDPLALLYSPKLYSSQQEFLLAKRARDKRLPSKSSGPIQGIDLYASARERLTLLGMTDAQIDRLEQADQADSRLELCAPISGTVISKAAVEGQYVDEGDVIYRLADLSNVWLMLRLFPEDAAAVHYGQKVNAEVQSLPGETFDGRVAFIDPNVDEKTRTVGVRVVIPNEDGTLRVGDYAKATMEVPPCDEHHPRVFDPELANKWISPRHPHVVSPSAGDCPICGIPLVPAREFGFTDQPVSANGLVVPRDAVLMAGRHSVVYVETDPGHFELRQVVLGPSCGDRVFIQQGLRQGERVASRGNFLIDSQMQLAGNPSLIDPDKAERLPVSPSDTFDALSPEDRVLAERQGVCPVADQPLGSMGPPKKVLVHGTSVFICCEGCRDRLLAEPDKYLSKMAAGVTARAAPSKAPAMDLPPIELPLLIEPADEGEKAGAEGDPEHGPRISGARREDVR